MRKIHILTVLLLLMTGSSYALKIADQRQQSDKLAETVRYQNKITDSIEIKRDLKFTSSVDEKGEVIDLLLDIYTPSGDIMTNRPVILWIHGGGFRGGNKTQKYIVMMSERFAKRGYVSISADYRLRDDPQSDIYGTINDAVEDAGKALNWIRDNSEMLGVDRDRIFVGGGSAGGILASNMCLRRVSDFPGLDRSGVIGFINLWGSPGDRWGNLEVSNEAIPTVIVHGTDDKSVFYSGSLKMKRGLDSLIIKNRLITIDGAGHTPVKHIDDFEKEIAEFLYDILMTIN